MSTQQDGPADEPTGTSETPAAENAPGDTDSSAGDTSDDAGTSPREYPRGWFTPAPAIQADRKEITVVGTLPDPEVDAAASDAERAAAAEGRIRRFREETRARRVEIAREAEHRFRRKVSWGFTCGVQSEMYTTLSVPVMPRLRQPERRVLDTLVE